MHALTVSFLVSVICLYAWAKSSLVKDLPFANVENTSSDVGNCS